MKSIVLALFLSGITLGFSQSVKGTITDETNQSLPFANIVIYEADNSNPLTGVVSDVNGNYEFNNLEQGKYSLEVSSLGFKTEKTDVFELTKDVKIFNFTLY